MIVEGVQLMSTALNKQAGGQIAPYKSAPGPTVLIDWTAQSQAQFMWVHEHTKALALEYYRRTKKQHKSFKHLRPLLTMALTRLKDGVLTGFVNYAKNKSKGLDYTHMQDVHKAYRLYLQQQRR